MKHFIWKQDWPGLIGLLTSSIDNTRYTIPGKG